MDSRVVYETLDATPCEVPERSRLCSLEPIGVGTPLVESLTSYIPRLALLHGVPTDRLCRHEIAPLLGKDYLCSQLAMNKFFDDGDDHRGMNGVEDAAQAWIQAVEQLTRRSDVRYTTMFPWADIVGKGELLCSYHRWCPLCYEEWQRDGKVIYEPLLWALNVITVCPVHHIPLQEYCPECQQPLRLLPRLPYHGYCPHCHCWLGAPLEHAAVEQSVTQTSVWIANVVGEMLAATPGLSAPLRRQCLVTTIATARDHLAGGNLTELSRQIGVDRTALYYLLRDERRAALSTLLNICYRLDLSLLQLLQDPSAIQSATIHEDRAVCFPATSLQKRDKTTLLQQFQEEIEREYGDIEPPSMEAVARRLGYKGPHRLRRNFPGECKKISKRYLAFKAEKKKRNEQKVREEIRMAVTKLLEQGITPTYRKVREAVDRPSSMGIVTFGDLCREILQEMGLK
jgi:transcriptional regulator with XRE-family HTH domain